MDYYKKALELHEKYKGKIDIKCDMPLNNREDLAVAYTPGVAQPCLEIAKANAQRAGVDRFITFEKRDIKDFSPKSEKGTVICNPPYGERLLDLKEAERIYKLMGERFERRHGWAYYIISPSEDFEVFFSRKADKRRKLYNGMIKCQLFMYFK